MPENLWVLREQKRISVAALANRAGLPIGVILEYESGQRSIEPRHLDRLARALYVEEAQIRLQSEPRPGAAPLERQSSRNASQLTAGRSAFIAPKTKERPLRFRSEPLPPGPARPSQIAALDNLLQRLERSRITLESELGKPVTELNRAELAQLLRKLQAQVQSSRSPARHRAYLPESVDEFETSYLTAAQEAGATLYFTLFDGSTAEGQIVGFGPFSITVRQADGSELTLNKLALVSYRTAAQPAAGQARQTPGHESEPPR